jgi:hypothetical protein
MKKLAFVAALVAIAVAVPLSLGSSHREAPLTSIDPTADDTDVYAFTAKNDPNTAENEEHALTVVANWIPFEDPAGGPNFYRFDDRARYYINVDNTGDGKYDVRYRFTFKTHVRNANSFLYAQPTVTSIDSPNLNVYQTYNIDRIGGGGSNASTDGGQACPAAQSTAGQRSGGQHGSEGAGTQSRRGGSHRKHSRHHRKHHSKRSRHHRKHHSRAKRSWESVRTVRIASNLPVAPNNVGPKTMPNYDAVAAQAIKCLPGGLKVFVGQRDDPFFVDLGTTFDSINFRKDTGAEGGGKDDLAGYSVHSIVLQVPESGVTKDGQSVSAQSASDAVVGVWASTERKQLQVNDVNDQGRGDWVQVSRLGNPLVNEVVIPLGQKDHFNRTTPDKDAELYGQYVVNPELAKVMNLLFGLGVKETDRTDIVQAVLQGLPGLNQQTGKPVDTIKINLGTDPAATPNRLGAVGGDLAGYPNGRRLTDDVVDIDLRVVEGALIGKTTPPLGDGIDQNDKAFSSSFPYLASPTSGFNSQIPKPIQP